MICDKKTIVNACGQSVLTTKQALYCVLNGLDISNVDFVDKEIKQKYIDNYEQIYYHRANIVDLTGVEPAVYHDVNTGIWNVPEEYMTMDIEGFLYEKCSTDAERLRVYSEIELYRKYELMSLLNVCLYMVDTFRKNNVIWGVGRGSSVSSFCLYLIGIHRVNSLKYQLDIHEFLKGE